MKPFGWDNVGQHVITGYAETSFDPSDEREFSYMPRAAFVIDYSRITMRNAMMLIIPLLFLFFLSLFTLSLDPIKYYNMIITVPSGCITGLLAYRFVIDSFSPFVGYFTIADHLFLLVLSIILIIFLTNFFSATLSKHFKISLVIFLHVVLLVTVFYLAWWGTFPLGMQ